VLHRYLRPTNLGSLGLCEHPWHPSFAKERNRIVGVWPDQNVLVVNKTDRAVREEKKIIEVVIAVAYTKRMFADVSGKLVKPVFHGWGWRHPELVPKKPKFEAGKFPPQACAI
jgi:hypothetical protein